MAAIAVVAGAAGWFATSSLQQDFRVVLDRGRVHAALAVDPYVNQAGIAASEALGPGVVVFTHSRFLYPPIVAELFRPFAALPYVAAKSVFTMLAVAAWVRGASVRATSSREGRALVLAAGALFYPLYLHLERGQVDLFVLLFLLVAFDRRARTVVAGAALAAAMAFKPALAGVLPVVAVIGRARVVGVALVGARVRRARVGRDREGPPSRGSTRTRCCRAPRSTAKVATRRRCCCPPSASRRTRTISEGGASRVSRATRLPSRSAWDQATASASLPRLLAPDGPAPLKRRARRR